MASIRISELRPAGSELFQDSESFLTELSESRELAQVVGAGDVRIRNLNVNRSGVLNININA
jgi:hypothetical protein